MTAAVAVAASPDCADLDVARSVLATEAAGLRALAAALDDNSRARWTCSTGLPAESSCPAWANPATSRRKIAATLASTGTPALFVHPAEASHGDLGMIVAGDAVLALSNSGETAELADLVAHTRRFAPAAGGDHRPC